MKPVRILILSLIASAFIISIVACASVPADTTTAQLAHFSPDPAAPKKRLRPFRSEQELKRYLRELAEEQRKSQARADEQKPMATPAPAQTAAGTLGAAKAASPAGKDESVTNVQEAGVDEGGIVKVHGDYLVMLRRGRLFTVAINDGALKPISTADAFGPGIDPSDTWYDEMLVADDTVAVIGYSYDRGGTEIGLFHIDGAGRLRYRSTYHLRSDDYYSSRNYASRLIGNKLIFYTPLYLYPGEEDPFENFPAIRRWHKGAQESEFRRIISPTRVYRPEHSLSGANGLALHTVTVCDLAGSELACQATAVVGAPGRSFYVSQDSVYVWTSDWVWRGGKHDRESSMLYRMPLNGSGPSALQVSGSPVDQFSFLESADAHLNVLVRSEAAGDGMWGPEVAAGDVALMRVPLGTFSDGSEAAPSSSYRKLPKPEGYTFQNRFVGDFLLYGTGSGWGPPEKKDQSNLYAVRWAGGRTTELRLAHGVDRIEALGADAIVVGTDGEDLYFTGVRLGEKPEVAHSYKRKEASQGELRSHGFFYKPDGPNSGMLGLPISGPGRPGYEHLFEESASILYLRNESLDLKELGELDARPERAVDDNCRASCVDWYGNARPLFLRGRVFALLGYEIVEGRFVDGRIREARRISYAPRGLKVTRR
ncbi:MAG TPA: beta-propeller domain-containing protein [Pyrinomonadaceae bacterium]